MATIKKTTKVTKIATEVKSVDQMQANLTAKVTEYIAAKRGHKLGELTNPRVIRTTRKEIARLHTAIRAAEIASIKESK